MDFVSEDIIKFAEQKALLRTFEICAIKACKSFAGPPSSSTALGKMLREILNGPTDTNWWIKLAYYTITNYQTGVVDWTTYPGTPAEKKIFEDALETLLETVIADLSGIFYTNDATTATNANLKTEKFTGATWAAMQALFDTWRNVTHPTWTVLFQVYGTGNDGENTLMVSYIET